MVWGGAKTHLGCIEVCDNVFIGTKAIILPNVKIGPNAIVAAGTVVTKDVPQGSVVAGVPAKVIGKFDDLVKKRIAESQIDTGSLMTRITSEWELFNRQREFVQ